MEQKRAHCCTLEQPLPIDATVDKRVDSLAKQTCKVLLSAHMQS